MSCDRVDAKVSAVIKLCTFCPLSFLGEGAGTVPSSGAEESFSRVDAEVDLG